MLKKILALFERKAAIADNHHSNVLNASSASWKSVNGEAYAKEGFARNVIAFRCVSIIAEALSDIPLKVKQNGDDVGDDHPLVLLLKDPNPMQTGSDFFEEFASYRLIDGNAYFELMNGSITGQPTELWSWTPFYMTVIGDDGEYMPRGYKWNNGKVKKQWPFIPENKGSETIIHWKSFNPLSKFYGMSPMEPGAMSIDQHNESSEWNMRSIQNGAVPSGLMTSEGAPIQPKQAKNIRAEMDKNQRGPKNARKTMIMEGKLKYQQLGMTPVDMDFLNTHKNSAQEIAAAYGVPLQLVPLPETQTNHNFKEARLQLHEDTVGPLAKEMIGILNKYLSPRYGNNVEIYYDPNDIEALATKRTDRMQAYDSIGFLTDNEKRQANSYEDYTLTPGADFLYQTAGEFPLGTFEDLPPEEQEKAMAATIMDYKGITIEEATKEARALIQSSK